MTIRELYEWAVEHGYEDFSISVNGSYGNYMASIIDIEVNEEWQDVTL